ncbi:MAG TPA: hypothetical protein VMV54_09645 [Acidocella sp.]|nr:hypothetical protein [Acidocella sp.]
MCDEHYDVIGARRRTSSCSGIKGWVAATNPARPNDIAADRLVFRNSGSELIMRCDPDGHFLLLDGRN